MVHLIAPEELDDDLLQPSRLHGERKVQHARRDVEPRDVLIQSKHVHLLAVVREVPADAAEAADAVVQGARTDADRRVAVLDEPTVQIRDHGEHVIAAASYVWRAAE